MLSCLLLCVPMGCQKRIGSTPPACPEWTYQEYEELAVMVASGEYPFLVTHIKRQLRQCKAINALRD